MSAVINKNNAMLLDIQYVKANRKEKTPDYLYIIWKNLDDGEKHLKVVPEPMMNIYFTKPEFRNHMYNKDFEYMNRLERKTVKYKDIVSAIADNIGDAGKQKMQEYFITGNYSGISDFFSYPYVYGADYDIRVWYRYQWLQEFHNNRPKPIRKGFMDIEVDGYEASSFPDPVFCPIDLITLVDASENISYTFSLIGVDCKEKDTTHMTQKQQTEELMRRQLYESRIQQQEKVTSNIDELCVQAHNMFDENYPNMEYKFFFYHDERKMLVHFFQLVNKLKLDFIGVWNISFDIPYIIDRLKALGLDPKQVICHPDFPVKECWFKKDMFNFQVKNKSDFFHVSSYTVFFDQMINYAAIRKGEQELRRNSLSYIAKKELKDDKLDYSEDGNIKTLSYRNFLRYILYNIKDVLLQVGIENRTLDLETYYITSYTNMTPYENVFKQTVKLRNVQYKSFMEQKLVPGANINALQNRHESVKEETDDDETEDDDKFEGALVGNPSLIGYFGVPIFNSKKTNCIFHYSIDFDMSRFYPSAIGEMNITASALIFKVILDPRQYNVRGGELHYNGITDVQLTDDNSDSFSEDVGKEVFDNFQTRNYLSTGHKWMNMPSVNDVYKKLKKKLG